MKQNMQATSSGQKFIFFVILVWSYSQISQKLSLSKRQVQYLSQQPATPKKHPSHRLILDTAEREHIINYITSTSKHRRIAYRKVIEAMDLDVSGKTPQQALKQDGFSCSITRIQLYILFKISQTCFNQALVRTSQTIENWRCML